MQEAWGRISHQQGISSSRSPPEVFGGYSQGNSIQIQTEAGLSWNQFLIGALTKAFRKINSVEVFVIEKDGGLLLNGKPDKLFILSSNQFGLYLQAEFPPFYKSSHAKYLLHPTIWNHGTIVRSKRIVGGILAFNQGGKE